MAAIAHSSKAMRIPRFFKSTSGPGHSRNTLQQRFLVDLRVEPGGRVLKDQLFERNKTRLTGVINKIQSFTENFGAAAGPFTNP